MLRCIRGWLRALSSQIEARRRAMTVRISGANLVVATMAWQVFH
jgi:hypothetical protein